MAHSASPTSWFSRLRGRAAQPQSDWADLGTAFGLDQSMRSRPAPADTAASAAPANPQAARAWWQRLGGGTHGR